MGAVDSATPVVDALAGCVRDGQVLKYVPGQDVFYFRVGDANRGKRR